MPEGLPLSHRPRRNRLVLALTNNESGAYKGRPKTVDDTKVLELKKAGLGAMAIARELGIGRATVYKSLQNAAQTNVSST